MAKAKQAVKKAAAPRPPKRVLPVPRGYHTVTPYLTVQGAAEAIDFYQRAFGAVEMVRMPGPGGRLMHAEVKIGDSVVMVSDEFPGMSGSRSPQSLGGTSGYVFLYVPDVDQTFRRAVDAGARVAMPLMDMFWGDRFGKVIDPFGHTWGMATHKEDVPPDEMAKRQREALAAMANRPS
jgi:PhnB protein